MIARFRLWLISMMVALDQCAHTFFAGPKYVIFGGRRPNTDETISSRVGRAALAGKRWGLMCEAAIDALFRLLGDGPGHCRRNIEWDEV
ncbi:hypothetical protein [Sphingobium fluviale]|uniref:Uncharacterized protein n=1 Tax=Sphingobium fluviale TaxID=2506423 RepID=A0A4Q1KGX4_9SPHN|nr:hypothetical protein [Sphingobium fluviale]RXR28963.1 hypothetical protein EQG66_07750 [Sphingobium fluviale]